MKDINLYAVLLGGKIRENHLMEDHHLVFVAAANEEEARRLARKKWNADDIHVDGTQQLNIVDGYQIKLEKTECQDDDFQLNSEYSV
ncbi:DUF1543 domain-containing protein [Ancylomarina salipaludis]|uniref:DUF1543 domain-containing protein n=1 Tax=Ancylomarina salipaludis TaxID=2501299 RepID=A0A4Q1JJK2_9BACT|nr:DUF1543 domain-containing protein [Ancylomarina salipaludis]RXQ91506.1 DUF1543 domain-containing protein [Ancylomarina salipaludis]